MFPGSLLEEEAAKRAELERIQLQQQRALSQTEAEKQELMAEQLAKERDLQAAMQQLNRLERERKGAVKQYEVKSYICFWIAMMMNLIELAYILGV